MHNETVERVSRKSLIAGHSFFSQKYRLSCSKTHNKIYVQLFFLTKVMVNNFNQGVIFLKIGYARVSTGLQKLDL